MKFKVIASGSKGNMTYIETDELKVLVDAGVSSRELVKRMDIDLSTINAIIITHEHGDHVGFLDTLVKKIKCPVYIHRKSFEELYRKKPDKYNKGMYIKYIEANQLYNIKDLQFMTLNLSHDSVNCLGFIFSCKGKSLGYISDTGFIPLPYIELLKKVDNLVIEANHDVEMELQSNRSPALKERNLSLTGHMSNLICGQVINQILETKKLKLAILVHISEECNDEKIAVDTIISQIEGDYIPTIKVAKQHEALDMYEV